MDEIVKSAAQYFLNRDKKREEKNRKRHGLAVRQLDKAVAVIIDRFSPVRIWTWGSILREERFNEMSDIDLAVEGITDFRVWSELEKTALSFFDMPLDLVRWEDLLPEHRESIQARGKIIYEKHT